MEAKSLLAGSCQLDPVVPTMPEPADYYAKLPPTAIKKKSLDFFFFNAEHNNQHYNGTQGNN